MTRVRDPLFPAPRIEDPIAASRERFVRETKEHAMTVLRDDDLYRHLRFRKPGTVTYGFDLVTWPGYLAVVGDCGDFLFSRTRDMFEFFSPSGARGGFEDARWGINPQYWSEKLQAPRPDAAMKFSYEAFQASLDEWFRYTSEELSDGDALSLRAAIQDEILSDYFYSEHEAHAALARFEHRGIRIHDTWEWAMREYDWSFLWCCWGIVWGIDRYLTSTTDDCEAVVSDWHEMDR